MGFFFVDFTVFDLKYVPIVVYFNCTGQVTVIIVQPKLVVQRRRKVPTLGMESDILNTGLK